MYETDAASNWLKCGQALSLVPTLQSALTLQDKHTNNVATTSAPKGKDPQVGVNATTNYSGNKGFIPIFCYRLPPLCTWWNITCVYTVPGTVCKAELFHLQYMYIDCHYKFHSSWMISRKFRHWAKNVVLTYTVHCAAKFLIPSVRESLYAQLNTHTHTHTHTHNTIGASDLSESIHVRDNLGSPVEIIMAQHHTLEGEREAGMITNRPSPLVHLHMHITNK